MARTVKGKGVALMEGKPGWHGKAPTKEELKKRIESFDAVILERAGLYRRLRLPSLPISAAIMAPPKTATLAQCQ